jgi:hypothetical protein
METNNKLPTDEAKKLFLELFPDTFTVAETAKRTGICRRTLYLWLETDPEFVKSFEDAKKTAIETLEREARRRAYEGVDKPVFQGGKEVGKVREYSDTLLMFILKKLDPSYRENAQVNINNNNLVQVKRIIYNIEPPAPVQEQIVNADVRVLPEMR